MNLLWLSIYFAVLVWSGINPHDYLTWTLEVFPALIALVVLAATRRVFPLTPLAYQLILMHCVILMVGGHYTYAKVPVFDVVGRLLGVERNNYDKLGHFAQGFVPAIVCREILIRKQIVNGRYWLNVIVVAFCLAISAFYELLEWWTALAGGQAAESFLGTQGYVWDTQSDMAAAVVGAVAGLVLLGKTHDRQLNSSPMLKAP